MISKLETQKAIFGNPTCIISNKGSSFTSKEFQDYCIQENIQHFLRTTELLRTNRQIERLNSVIISALSVLSVENPSKWYTHVSNVQQVINSIFQRSISTTPFELLFGTKMKHKNDIKITDLIHRVNTDFANKNIRSF